MFEGEHSAWTEAIWGQALIMQMTRISPIGKKCRSDGYEDRDRKECFIPS